MSDALEFGSTFSGVGAMDLGLERAGIRVVFQASFDLFRRTVLASHGPPSPDTKTSGLFVGNQRREWRQMPVSPAVSGAGGTTQTPVWMESAEDLPVKISVSLDDGPGCEDRDPACSMSSFGLPTSLFDQADGSSLRTSPACSVPTVDEISPSFSVRWATSGFATSPGEFWTAVTSECPSDGDGSSSLPDVLLPPEMVPDRVPTCARKRRWES